MGSGARQLGVIALIYEGTPRECRAAADGRTYVRITPTMRNQTIGRRLRAMMA